MRNNRTRSKHFFQRSEDNTVRIRIRFMADAADLIEEAAGDTDLIAYIETAVTDRARADLAAAREQRPAAGRPTD